MIILELRDVSAAYGDVDIVSKINLSVSNNEIVTIAGTNGAGKSTITKAVMGLVPRCSGEMHFLGNDLAQYPPDQRIRLGIGYVPQVANVFASLTVLENLQVTEYVRERKTCLDRMFHMFPALAERRRTRAFALSGGERQQLALARALMSEPKLIILDEPTAALSPALVTQVFDMIKRLREIGVAVLVVEQRARRCLAISDRGYILDSGNIVMSGPARALLEDAKMADLYLGRA